MTNGLGRAAAPAQAGWGDAGDAFLAALKQRDTAAIGALFDRHEALVNRLVWRFLGADSEHNDLVQRVFLHALESVGSLRSTQGLESWMTSLTINTVRSELRRRRFRRFLRLEQEGDESGPAEARPEPEHRDDFDARDALRRTYGVLGALPADEQIAFVLRYFDGQSLEQTAEACACSLATIKRRLSRAEERFAKLASADPVLAERVASGQRWGQP